MKQLISASVGSLLLGIVLAVVITRGCTDTPPGPTPTPIVDESPIKRDGLCAIIVYESALGVPEQVNGAVVRNYIRTKFAKDEFGEPEFRTWDQDAELKFAPKHLADAMKRPRGELPWIIIGDGKKGEEGKLPETREGVLNLLKKYGGEIQ